MAKGVEDTAFYRYSRLLALNEVGGDPGRFGTSVGGVPRRGACSPSAVAAHDDHAVHPRHQALRGRARAARFAVRGRQGVGKTVAHLLSLATKYTGPAGPDTATQYFICQTLVGPTRSARSGLAPT